MDRFGRITVDASAITVKTSKEELTRLLFRSLRARNRLKLMEPMDDHPNFALVSPQLRQDLEMVAEYILDNLPVELTAEKE